MKKQLRRLEAKRKCAINKNPDVDTNTLSREIKQLKADIEEAKQCLSVYYASKPSLVRSKST
jgi:tellurite resistance protein